MTEQLSSLLKELELYGSENDARVLNRGEKMLNITPDTGPFLALLIQAVRATHVLEIGTSNGYSTLWLAQGVELTGGSVTTVEVSPFKVGLARKNFERSGLESRITLAHQEAGDFFKKQRDRAFDFLFLDSFRVDYPAWWPDIQRVLLPHSLIICDNARTHTSELEPFRAIVSQTPGFIQVVVPLGHGLLMILNEK